MLHLKATFGKFNVIMAQIQFVIFIIKQQERQGLFQETIQDTIKHYQKNNKVISRYLSQILP